MPGFPTTPGHPGPRAHAPVCIAFRLRNGVGTRDMNLNEAQWRAYVVPYRRFAGALAGDRCGSLLLHHVGLAPITHCRSPGALRKFLETTSRLQRNEKTIAHRYRQTRDTNLVVLPIGAKAAGLADMKRTVLSEGNVAADCRWQLIQASTQTIRFQAEPHESGGEARCPNHYMRLTSYCR